MNSASGGTSRAPPSWIVSANENSAMAASRLAVEPERAPRARSQQASTTNASCGAFSLPVLDDVRKSVLVPARPAASAPASRSRVSSNASRKSAATRRAPPTIPTNGITGSALRPVSRWYGAWKATPSSTAP